MHQCDPLSHGLLVMYSDILWVTCHVLLQMKDLIKLLNTGLLKTALLLSILVTFVRPGAIILDLFWVVFYEIIPQVCSSLYKIFASHAMQSSESHMLRFLT